MLRFFWTFSGFGGSIGVSSVVLEDEEVSFEVVVVLSDFDEALDFLVLFWGVVISCQ